MFTKSRVMVAALSVLTAVALTACGGGDGGGGGGSSMVTPPGGTDFAGLDATRAPLAAAAAGRAADATPKAGSVTQSSNVDVDNVTLDQVEVEAMYTAGIPRFMVRNGSSWSIDSANGDPTPIPGVTDPFEGVEMSSRVSGGLLYVAAYTDIEPPKPGGGGQPVSVNVGDQVEYTGSNAVLGRGQSTSGELDGQPGTFTCASTGCSVSFRGGLPNQGSPLPVASVSGITFVPSAGAGTIADPDYLAGGVWLFVPDGATSAAQVTFGAFADGNDPFRQSDLTAISGSARYEGLAAGLYSAGSGAETELGYWGGSITLNADFGGAGDLGTISGSLTNVSVDDERYAGSLTLGAASIGSTDSGFFEGDVSGTVEGTAYSGKWGGQFFGNGEADGKPGSVAGTLGGRSANDTVTFVGGFGAYKR